jgi:hypothetical protein
MTFAEYNTDDNFNKPSNAMELVKLGKDEGKTRDEILNSLSPLWKEDKKGNVKKALDYYFPEEVKTETKVTTPEKAETVKPAASAPATTKPLGKEDSQYVGVIDAFGDNIEQTELNNLEKNKNYNWSQLFDSVARYGNAMKQVDDHYIENLPTSISKRYKNGEFGEAGSKDAKSRLAYFIIDAIASPLKALSNGLYAQSGRAPLFSDTESQYEKYQKSNLANAMENRWNKYKQETEGAIEMVKKEGMSEQDARLAVEQLTRNGRMNTKWNMMNEKQKKYAIQVTKEIGDYIGDMDLDEIANFIAGASINGDIDKNEVVAIGLAKLAAKSPELMTKLPDGDMKNFVSSILPSFGGSTDKPKEEGDKKDSDSIIDEEKTGNKVLNPSGNLKGYKALDGKTYDFSTFENKDGKEKLVKLIKDLDDRFYSGEINAETYRKYRDPLYKEAGKHIGIKASTTDDALKANVEKKLKDLNKNTKNGSVTVNDYKEQTAKIIAMAEDAGMSAEAIAKLKKDFINTDKIKYKGPGR